MKFTGSVPYTAPEILNGGSKTRASDIYAYAMTLSEVFYRPLCALLRLIVWKYTQTLSGQTPFSTLPSPGAITLAIVQGTRPPKVPEYSSTGQSYAPLWQLAVEGWGPEPNSRPVMSTIVTRLKSIAAAELSRTSASSSMTVSSIAGAALSRPSIFSSIAASSSRTRASS
jgi:serine/threonine protein kinase